MKRLKFHQKNSISKLWSYSNSNSLKTFLKDQIWETAEVEQSHRQLISHNRQEFHPVEINLQTLPVGQDMVARRETKREEIHSMLLGQWLVPQVFKILAFLQLFKGKVSQIQLLRAKSLLLKFTEVIKMAC
jgi:hypothetical protein